MNNQIRPEFLHAPIPRHRRCRWTIGGGVLEMDKTGRLLALRMASRANLEGYATPAGAVIQLLIGRCVSTSIYDIATIDIGIKGVLSNAGPTAAYRGAGRPEAIYRIERLMDTAARELKMDPGELHRRDRRGSRIPSSCGRNFALPS